MVRIIRQRHGFALPTILIASVIMLIVLITTVSSTASIRSALDNQYYTQLAREAAESGLARANACLSGSSYAAQWSTASPLHANTACTGGASCTNADTCFVMRNGDVRTNFTVNAPTSQNVSQVVVSTGTVELTRTTTGDVWRTFTYSASGRLGVNLNLNTVAFGYVGATGGSYFATIAADGLLRAAGYNGNGQLGNGTTTNSLTPTVFQLNGTDKPSAIFTNFVSGGTDIFVLTNNGTIYGSGANSNGQLGDRTTTDRTTPVNFALPAGKTPTNVLNGGISTYVTTSDNNIYAAGACASGLLGYTYTIAGCANKSSYVRVALPTPTSDPNTQPSSNEAFDRLSVYVRMNGGRIYGWGSNYLGQLVNGNETDQSTPVQIGTYGNTGQPKATNIAFDGDTFYVTDDSGAAMAVGRNTYGELGGDKVPIELNGNTSECLDNKNQDGLTVQFHACNGTVAQQWSLRSDGSIYNANTNKCLDNKAGDGVTMQLWTCNSTVAQQYIMRDDSTLYNASSGKCLNNKGADGVTLILFTCGNFTNEFFTLPESGTLHSFPLPSGSGNAIKVTTDQYFASVLTDTGQVWSAGINNVGQLGNGSTAIYQPYPVKFILPVGVTAVDIATTSYNPSAGSYADTFVVGSDGRVYGAGANSSGQLGDGTTTNRSTPVAMSVIDGSTIKAQKVLSGYGTTVILTTDKKVYTVGNNSYGQLGDGTTTNSSTPRANRFTNVLPLTQF